MLMLLSKIVLGMVLTVIMLESVQAQDHAFTVYAGRITEDTWLESLSLNTELADAYILVGAWSWTVHRYLEGSITLEIEGQAAKYFGDQKHVEFNLPLALRWHMQRRYAPLELDIAFGIGPSWATEDPKVELARNDSTSQFLVYWFLEIALGPPGTYWAGVFRLHHRSSGFGTVAEEGGSNTLAGGVKFRF